MTSTQIISSPWTAVQCRSLQHIFHAGVYKRFQFVQLEVRNRDVSFPLNISVPAGASQSELGISMVKQVKQRELRKQVVILIYENQSRVQGS